MTSTQRTVAEIRAEADLDVSEDVRWSEVEYGTDGTGRKTYRHVLTTEWQVVPGE